MRSTGSLNASNAGSLQSVRWNYTFHLLEKPPLMVAVMVTYFMTETHFDGNGDGDIFYDRNGKVHDEKILTSKLGKRGTLPHILRSVIGSVQMNRFLQHSSSMWPFMSKGQWFHFQENYVFMRISTGVSE